MSLPAVLYNYSKKVSLSILLHCAFNALQIFYFKETIITRICRYHNDYKLTIDSYFVKKEIFIKFDLSNFYLLYSLII